MNVSERAPLTCSVISVTASQGTQSTNETSVELEAYSGGKKGQKSNSLVYVRPVICFRLQGVVWKFLRADRPFLHWRVRENQAVF